VAAALGGNRRFEEAVHFVAEQGEAELTATSSFPDVQLHIVDAPLGAGPETHNRGYGFSDVQLHITARAAHAPE
jgi:hypothetical protein